MLTQAGRFAHEGILKENRLLPIMRVLEMVVQVECPMEKRPALQCLPDKILVLLVLKEELHCCMLLSEVIIKALWQPEYKLRG